MRKSGQSSPEGEAGQNLCPVCGLPLDSGDHAECKQKQAADTAPEQQTAPEQEQTVDTEQFKARQIDFIKDHLRFEIGESTPENEAQKYIENLAARLPSYDNFPLQVKLAPDWKVSNALCIADGTVYISPNLIKEAETEEALLGVIAHEYVHTYRKHHQKIEETQGPNIVTEALTRLGQARVYEYEADLRGTLVDLDKAGINPNGYKDFLHRLHEKETWGGDIHGSSFDRALNISTAFYAYDFQSIEEDLHQIPPEVIQTLDEDNSGKSFSAITRRPTGRSTLWDKEIPARQKARRKAIEELDSVELLHAIDKVTSYSIEAKRPDPDDDQVLEILYQKFQEHYTPQTKDEFERQVMEKLGLEYFAGANVLSKPKKEFLISMDDFEKARVVFEKYAEKIEIPYALNSVDQLLGKTLDLVMEKKIFGDLEKGEADLKVIKKFVDNWSQTLTKISTQHDTEQIYNPENLQNKAVDKITDQIEGNFELRLKVRNLFAAQEDGQATVELQERRSNLPESMQEELSVLGQKLNKSKTSRQYAKTIKEAGKELEKLLDGQPLKIVTEAITEIYTTYQAARFKEDESINTRGELILSEGKPHSAVATLFKHCLENLPQFAEMSDKEKKIILMSSGFRLELDFTRTVLMEEIEEKKEQAKEKSSEGQDEWEKHPASPDEIDEQSRLLKRMAKDIDSIIKEDFLYEELTEEDIENLYQYFADEKHFDNNVGYLTDTQNPRAALIGEQRVARAISIFLKDKDLDEVLRKIDEFEKRGIPARKIMTEHPIECSFLLRDVIAAVESDQTKSLELPDLLYASQWIQNPFLQGAFQRHVIQERWQEMSFEEKLNLCFPQSGQIGASDYKLREQFIEHDITTKEQFEQITTRMRESAEEFMAQSSAERGAFVLLDRLNFRFHDVNAFLRALLKSGENDKELKTIIYELTGEINPGQPYTLEERLGLTSDAIRNLYSLDDMAKHALLRKLLTSEGGALPDTRERKKFFKMLSHDWLDRDDSEKEIADVLDKIMDGMSDVRDWQLIYFGMHSTIADKIAVPPDKKGSVPFHDIHEIYEDIIDAHTSSPKDFSSKALWESIPKTAQEKPYNYTVQYSRLAETKLYDVLNQKGVLTSPENSRMKPLEFIKKAVSRTGAMGVRFLQILPQFVELSQRHQEEFSEVYDNVKGQSKLAALALLEREWPEFWQEIESVGDRVGGGSNATVFEAKTKDGEEEVIKVRNPNIKYHLDQTERFVKEVMAKLAKKHGGVYKGIQTSIDDLREWVNQDLDFEGFLEQDKEFRDKYEGFTSANNDYKVTIPKSKGPDNPYFSREEKISGTNLTQWEELEKQGHDMKQITSLMVKMYLAEILDGKVHSDIHPGNFSVTEDKRLVVYDRNFFLNLSKEEQETIIDLFNPQADQEANSKRLLDYFELPKNVSQKEVAQLTSDFTSSLAGQEWNKAYKSLIAIKQQGVKMPLNFTLLLKNLHSLRSMTNRAGFSDISKALAYVA